MFTIKDFSRQENTAFQHYGNLKMLGKWTKHRDDENKRNKRKYRFSIKGQIFLI